MRFRHEITGERGRLEADQRKDGGKRGLISDMRSGDAFQSAKRALAKVFLPVSFPHSVSSDYLEFQGVSGQMGRACGTHAYHIFVVQRGIRSKPCVATCAAFLLRRLCSRDLAWVRVRGSLTCPPMPLIAVSIATATPLAAAVQWVARDLTGMLANLAFATWGARRCARAARAQRRILNAFFAQFRQ